MKKISLLSFLSMLPFMAYAQIFDGGSGIVQENTCGIDNDFPIPVSGVGVLGTANVFDQVGLDISINYVGDLDIFLVAPDGTVIRLAIGQGNDGVNYTNTSFRADAPISILDGVAPFTGSYLPEGDLSLLNGKDADGIWYLRVCNMGLNEIAYLNFSYLSFVPTPACLSPTNVFADIIAPTSAHFIWDPVPGVNSYHYVLNESPVYPTVPGDITQALETVVNDLLPEKTYFFHVRSDCGGELSGWSSTVFVTSPVNDNCIDATEITALPYNNTQNIAGATNNGGVIMSCAAGMNDGVWYEFNVSVGGNMQLNVSGLGDWDAEIAVYKGTCDLLECVGSSDVGTSRFSESLILNNVTPGQYFVNIGNSNGAVNALEGEFTLDVTGNVVLTTLNTGNFDRDSFSYYPNPVKNYLNLTYNRNITNVAVFNLLGQQIMAIDADGQSPQVDMSALSSGTYVVKVEAEGQVQAIKIVKE